MNFYQSKDFYFYRIYLEFMRIFRLIVLIVIILSFFSISLTSSLSNFDGFSQNILLSTSDTPYPHHVEPTLAVSENGTLFAGWKNAYTDNGGGVRVSFSKSVDNGVTWSTPFDMPLFNSSITTGQSDPWMVWFNKTIYYAYLEFDLNDPFVYLNRSQITLAQSTDYGATWTLSKASNNTYFADKETMTIASDGTIYIAYDDTTLADSLTKDVRLSVSTDGGYSFNDTLVINDVDGVYDQGSPYLMTNRNDDLFVTWIKFPSDQYQENYIVFDKLSNGTFGKDQNMTSESLMIKFSPPSLKIDSKGRLYLLWSDSSNSLGDLDVYIRWSDDNGESWHEKMRVNPDTSGGHQWMPDMAIDKNDNLHIVYYDEQGDSFKSVFQFINTNSNQMTVYNPLDIASVPTSSSFVRPGDYFTVQVDSNLITHVIWSDGRNNEMDIYYSHCACVDFIESTSSTTTATSSTTPSSTTTFTITTTSESSNPATTDVNPLIIYFSLVILTIVYREKRSK